jgi:AcrR family transcriptional regulator
MTDASAVLDRAADAALELAADRPWASVTLGEIAERAGVSFAELYARTPSKSALLDRVSRRFDAAAASAELSGEVHDRLFEAVMARIEAMEPHRFPLIAIARDEPRARIATRWPRTARTLLEAAEVPVEGLAGAARTLAMTAVWGRVLQVWRDDEGALNRTMAEIDKRLREMRERLGRIGAGF